MEKETLSELIEDEMGCANYCPMKDKAIYDINLCACYKAEAIRELQKQDPIPCKEVISIHPGDVVTLTTPYELSAKEIDALKFTAASIMPDGVNVMVLSGGATLEVYREQLKNKASKASNCLGDCTKCNARCMDRQEPLELQIERNEGLM